MSFRNELSKGIEQAIDKYCPNLSEKEKYNFRKDYLYLVQDIRFNRLPMTSFEESMLLIKQKYGLC